MEERLLNIEGIKEMRSVASQGSGSINLEFDINRNVDVVLQEVQTNLSRMRWPTGSTQQQFKRKILTKTLLSLFLLRGRHTLKNSLSGLRTI